MQYLVTFCSRPEAAGDAISCTVVGPVVVRKIVKFHDPILNDSPEIPPEAVVSGIFDRFLYNFRPDVVDDVMSSVAIDNVGVNVCVKFGDSSSNGLCDIRRASFRVERTKERTNMASVSPQNDRNQSNCENVRTGGCGEVP